MKKTTVTVMRAFSYVVTHPDDVSLDGPIDFSPLVERFLKDEGDCDVTPSEDDRAPLDEPADFFVARAADGTLSIHEIASDVAELNTAPEGDAK